MIDIQTISIIVGIFIGLGTLIAGSGFAYAQFKSGGDKYKDNLIETLKETALAEKAEKERLAIEKNQLMVSHQEQLTQLNKDLAELRGRFDEQSKKVKEYQDILQGKDPGQLKYMETMTKGLNTALEYIQVSQPVLLELKKYLDKQNRHGRT